MLKTILDPKCNNRRNIQLRWRKYCISLLLNFFRSVELPILQAEWLGELIPTQRNLHNEKNLNIMGYFYEYINLVTYIQKAPSSHDRIALETVQKIKWQFNREIMHKAFINILNSMPDMLKMVKFKLSGLKWSIIKSKNS